MLRKILEKDKILGYLLDKANFTKLQLDTLMINRLNKGELNLNQRISLRDGKSVSKGSFIRTMRQAQKNVERSLYTIIISEYLSIIDRNSFLSLVRIGELLKELQTQKINAEEVQPILSEISSAVSNIWRKSS